MDFEFLPKLPKSDLDDRTFKDLVDECVLRIPRYCPEWTNYNPSDPGITLIELFAWLTDQMLLRFNQVPRRNYVAFLELLGIRLQPPTPAQTTVTFYLTRPQSATDRLPPIAVGTEVATERTDTEEAVVFTTEQPLELGVPRIRHFLSAEAPHASLNEAAEQERLGAIANLRDREALQQQLALRDRLTNFWREEEERWSGREQPVFRRSPQVGNCFYLVFDGSEPLAGNVVALTIEGEPGSSTGIDPRHPPRRWEAWDGEGWRATILQQESDDQTFGFSFDESGVGNAGVIQSAEVRLHLPVDLPVANFQGYQGRWVRCVYTEPEGVQAGYSYSPQFVALSARTVGATTLVTQAQLVENELLGESDGKPGQVVELQATNILPRREGECLTVTPPGTLVPQVWQEVEDFSESGPDDLHYTLDSATGRLQFGPLIREPSQLPEEVATRRQVQVQGQTPTSQELDALDNRHRQYGAVPPRGSVLRMVAYRTGGGKQGNVQAQTIKILKSAIPYVSDVINVQPARNGADAESLDEAVLRVPRWLRTRDRAVTPEDYETLALVNRAVARAHCPRSPRHQPKPGTVQLLIVPRVASAANDVGLAPEQLRLSGTLRQDLQDYLDERRLLGTEVVLAEPEYRGVVVQAELSLQAEYRSPSSQLDLNRRLQAKLYDFLNPLSGGKDGQGWPFGQKLYKADIMALFQQFSEVRYVETVELFTLQQSQESRLRSATWERTLAREGVVDPGELGLITSWRNAQQSWGHVIQFLGEPA